MARITVTNEALGTAASLYLPPSGVVTKRTRHRVRQRLKTPPGFPGAGPLGEYGPQRPPEAPGWEYQFLDLEDGRVQAVPQPIAQEVAR